MSDLTIRGLRVRVGVGARAFDAVDGVDLDVPSGSVVGLVGESGSGKSTLARGIVGLVPPRGGSVLLDAVDHARARGRRLADLRRRVQLVFQDPRASLNPRMTVGEAIGEAVAAHRRGSRQERAAEVARLLELVAVDPALASARPARLSGGQRQRIALARALAVRPDVIVADEVTAALDVSVQGAVLNLLRDLRRETGLSLVVISHDLAIVRYLSDSVAVMHLGRVVEHGTIAEVLDAPRHPYTRTLIESATAAAPSAAVPVGEAPDPLHPPSGCRYRLTCPVGPAHDAGRRICLEADPGAGAAERAHRAACHFAPGVAGG
ncbi:MAG TPA: ABC transporter ATP-binding protein [Baekduia sp.]|uniref:ABC transporter ATP-binding protein n=1 Tax=Baekduia sp. TaxID=2600305 RepID=UPI002D79AC91|nr:ABC transporter ATP-binding protein [Baekduia sp.]HET6505323.1 ABC transporter ATP-binding protein [Baekduia sp.]